MGLAFDTIALSAVNPGASGAAPTVATGDSLTVRNFSFTDDARIIRIGRAGAASGFIQVRSPLLHDNVRGIRFTSAENPGQFFMPRESGQKVLPQDTLIALLSGGTAESDAAFVQIYYANLPGVTARLHSWADIKPLIVAVKPVEVDIATGTITTWVDTVITTTENLLKANTDYAVLGYNTDVAAAFIGVKGIDTGNLRIGGPATASSRDTDNFFIDMSVRENLPCIPVFNAANQGAFFVSSFHNTGTINVTVQLILAQLSQNLPN